MKYKNLFRSTIGLAMVLVVVLVTAAQGPAPSAFTPPPEVQGQSFSITTGDPLNGVGVNPADVLVSGVPLILCFDLGLLCRDVDTGTYDDIQAVSFGWDFGSSGLPLLQFSVDAGSRGLPGTAVRVEADCSPAEPQGDVFETSLDGANEQDLDGDGLACGSNSGLGLALSEGSPADNLDTLERDPCLFPDPNCDGLPDDPILLALAGDSPSLDLVGATGADILVAGIEFVPTIWAGGSTDLGLVAGDEIDALCVGENGNAEYDDGDRVLFSLAPGSPSLASLSASPADLLAPAPLRVLYPAGALGLETADNVDALNCETLPLHERYLPLVFKDWAG
ncbi:MAG: hypothetical protein PVF47_14565 [Anaerolineae bacterium]